MNTITTTLVVQYHHQARLFPLSAPTGPWVLSSLLLRQCINMTVAGWCKENTDYENQTTKIGNSANWILGIVFSPTPARPHLASKHQDDHGGGRMMQTKKNTKCSKSNNQRNQTVGIVLSPTPPMHHLVHHHDHFALCYLFWLFDFQHFGFCILFPSSCARPLSSCCFLFWNYHNKNLGIVVFENLSKTQKTARAS